MLASPTPHAATLLLAPLPPSRCGIASYAAEHLQRLKEEGQSVITISQLDDSAADLRINLKTVSGCLAALMKTRRLKASQLVVHYADNQFFPWRMPAAVSRALCRTLQSTLLRALASRVDHSVLVVHEVPTSTDLPAANTRLRERAFVCFDEIAFHTDSMRRAFLARFARVAPERTTVIDHARYMSPRFTGSRADARSALGLPESETLFLCIGFIQESKGFHEAVQAFALARSSNASLHVTGSIRSDHPETLAYADSLRSLCATTPATHFHEQYLDDTTFDTWLAAADVLILPYLGVASSGVGARASLYGTSLIVRDLPNLTEQFPDAITFADIEELSQAMRAAVRTSRSLSPQ